MQYNGSQLAPGRVVQGVCNGPRPEPVLQPTGQLQPEPPRLLTVAALTPATRPGSSTWDSRSRNRAILDRSQKVVNVFVDFDQRKARVLGIVLVVLSVLNFIWQGVGMAMYLRMKDPRGFYVSAGGFGWFCSFPSLLAGILALLAARFKTGCYIRGTLGFAIVSVLFGLALFGSTMGSFFPSNPSVDYAHEKTSFAMAVLMFVESTVIIMCSIWLTHLCRVHLRVCGCCQKTVLVERDIPGCRGNPQLAQSEQTNRVVVTYSCIQCCDNTVPDDNHQVLFVNNPGDPDITVTTHLPRQSPQYRATPSDGQPYNSVYSN